MELALSLEKLTNEKLLNLHSVSQFCWILVLVLLHVFCYIGLVRVDNDIIEMKWKLLFNLMYIVWQVATKNGDVQLVDFVESEFLGEQVYTNLVLLPLTIFYVWPMYCI